MKHYKDEETQTVIRVYPFVVDEHAKEARIASDKKFNTELTLSPTEATRHFYSLLSYTPYQDIKQGSMRVLDLPRKPKLQFSLVRTDLFEAARAVSLLDDDGVSEACNDIVFRHVTGAQTKYVENWTQTEVTVRPHILDENRIATVLDNAESQTASDDQNCGVTSGRCIT